jgi:NADH-quinone oxidoreductase subunit N
VTALMATGVKAAAFAALIRVFLIGFAGHYEDWSQAAVRARRGDDGGGEPDRAHAGLGEADAGVLVHRARGLPAGGGARRGSRGTAAFLFYLLVYTLMTAGAFGIVIANSRDGVERVTLEDYAGLASQRPLLAGLRHLPPVAGGLPAHGGVPGPRAYFGGSIRTPAMSLSWPSRGGSRRRRCGCS